MTQGGFLIVIHVMFEFIDNRTRVLTATRRTRIVEVKDSRNFFGCARAIVVPCCDINRRRNNAVPIVPPKGFHT